MIETVAHGVPAQCQERQPMIMKANIAILLGAGSSVAADFPSTQELTDLVLSGHGVTRSDDGSYYIPGNDEPPTVVLRCVTSMARRFHADAELYYSAYAGRRTNYEDIYYLARQVSDELLGEMENPAIHAFVNKLKTDISPLVKAANAKNEDSNEPYEQHIPNNLTELLEETCNYIADVVSKSLSRSPASESQLSIIEHVCKSAHVASISTLCHDTHIERFLKSTGIALCDGFSTQTDFPYWNGDLASDVKTTFLKLHGSVDWFRYPDGKIRRVSPDSYPQRIEIDNDRQYAEDGRPLLLIGTFNKMSDYSSGIFRELHYRFRSTLRKASTLIVCGYSFGDKGINEEIVEWVHGEKGRRLVIIHPDPNILVANARGAIQKNWDDWKKSDSINLIERKFECVDIDEFEKAIDP